MPSSVTCCAAGSRSTGVKKPCQRKGQQGKGSPDKGELNDLVVLLIKGLLGNFLDCLLEDFLG